MPDPGKELSSIDFKSLIGGPLIAVVEAQAQAALSTVNFIREVGFKTPAKDTSDVPGDFPTTGDPVYVVFKYPKEISPYEPETSTPARFQEMKLEVPILTIVPIPYLRVEEVTIDFNAKINSMTSYEYTKASGYDTASSTSGSGGFLFGKVSASFKCSTSTKSNSKSAGQVERTYSLAVHVRAVQDELPGGMEKVLGILEDAIRAQPASATKEVVE